VLLVSIALHWARIAYFIPAEDWLLPRPDLPVDTWVHLETITILAVKRAWLAFTLWSDHTAVSLASIVAALECSWLAFKHGDDLACRPRIAAIMVSKCTWLALSDWDDEAAVLLIIACVLCFLLQIVGYPGLLVSI